MADPMSWRGRLETKLAGEPLVDVIVSSFTDAPKALRVGLVGLTDRRLVFYRKKVFGDELVSINFEEIVSAEAVDDTMSSLLSSAGHDARSVTLTLQNGHPIRMLALTADEAKRIIDAATGAHSRGRH